MRALRMLAGVATFVALAAFGAAVGDFASDPSARGAVGLLVLVAAMGFALARLYGPSGVAALRPREPARAAGVLAAEASEPRERRPPRVRRRTRPERPRRQRASLVEEAWTAPLERGARRLRRAPAEDDGRIDLNRASAAEIATLPGVGPASGERIVAERRASGPFATVSDLARVEGFSPERIRRLADRAKV